MARGQSGSACGGLPRGALRYQHCSFKALTFFVLFAVTSVPLMLSGLANFLLPPECVCSYIKVVVNLCLKSYLLSEHPDI